MNITDFTIRNKTVTWMVVLLLIFGGIFSFTKLGRLEDPAFTIKQAMILIDYPGASALEVEEEVTLPVENALQQLPYLDNISSTSSDGLSQIMVEMKCIYRKHDLAQIWDEMRSKINDLHGQLPPGVEDPLVVDEFGDVYGMFLAITGEGYSYDELADYTDYLRRELVLVPGVGKVTIGGRRMEQVFIEVDRAKFAATDYSLSDIEQVTAILESEPAAVNVRQDWRERTKVLRPVYNEAEGRRLGISKSDLDQALAMNVSGQTVGLYRHGSELLPIVLRPPEIERNSVSQLEDILVYSRAKHAYVNIGQVMKRVDLEWEDPLIKRRDRKRTLFVLADPVVGVTPATLHARIRGAVEAIELPEGYLLEWGGEYEAQQKANIAVFTFVPLWVLVMVVLTVILFGSAKQTLVVWTTVPLSIIGVTIGLLSTDSPLSFMALLALLSLIGMQLKNGIVLVEEIKRMKEELNQEWLDAITNAAISRLRPVTMAAVTTILGMLPLLSDVFFRPMAVTIMFGLGFSTLLTLIMVPVLFALLYRVRFSVSHL